MASIINKQNGFLVRVRVQGYPNINKTFKTLKQAQVWATITEDRLKAGVLVPELEQRATRNILTLDQSLTKYSKTVTLTKKGYRQELVVIRAIKRSCLPLVKQLHEIEPRTFTKYKDSLVGEGLSASTVQKRLALLSHLYTTAIKAWGFTQLTNPLDKVAKPRVNNARERRVSDAEFNNVLEHLPPMARAIAVIAFETAARASEIQNLVIENVSFDKGLMTFNDTKNGDSRTIPINSRVKRVLAVYRVDAGQLFAVNSDYISTAWSRATKKAGITNLHFHDLRHERITRLAEAGLNTLELAGISGHKTMSMLKRYTHLSPEYLGGQATSFRTIARGGRVPPKLFY